MCAAGLNAPAPFCCMDHQSRARDTASGSAVNLIRPNSDLVEVRV